MPAASACFGAATGALPALSGGTRMERVGNMPWDERALDPAAEGHRAFLLDEPAPGGASPARLFLAFPLLVW